MSNLLSMAETKNGRIFWLDISRSFAILSITMNHAINRAFDMDNTLQEFLSMPVGLSVFKAFFQVVSRIGVPIFLMITGALLLSRDYSKSNTVDRFYRHNWFSLFITAEIWYLIFYLYKSVLPDSILRTKGIGEALIQMILNQVFINQDTFASMWYMSMILCVYLVIPFIALGMQKIRIRFLMIPILIALLSGFLFPNVNSALNVLLRGDPEQQFIEFGLSIENLFSIYVVYIVIGKWISDGVLKKISNIMVVFGLIISLCITAGYQFWAFSEPGNYIIKYHSIGILFISVLLFECIRRFEKYFRKWEKSIVLLSNISLGIYFVHICIMKALVSIVPSSMGHIIRFIILEMISLLGSVIIIQLLRRNVRLSRLLFRI